MRPPCAQAVRFGGVLLLALAAAPAAAGTASGERNASIERLGESAPKKPGGPFEGQRFAQAPGLEPGAVSMEKTDGTTPLGWLRYSSERFRALMRMLATRSARSEAARAAKAAEAKRAAEAEAAAEAKRAAAETKRAAEAKAVAETKRAAEAEATAEAKRAAAETKRAAEAKAVAETKRAAEAKAAAEAKRAAEAKAVAETKRAAEADAKRAAEGKAAAEVEAEAKRAADAKAAAETKRAADAKAAAAAEAKRAADARKAVDITQAGKARSTEQPAGAKEPVQTRRKRPRATCRNSGVRVRGSGWYVIQAGDSLWSIARAHYGYGRAYRRIYAANRRSIANPARIYPCQRIYIPRSTLGTAPLQGLRVALAPFVRRRAIDAELPGLED